MRTRNYFLLLIILVAVSCNAYKIVYYDYDHSIDFSKYKTFAWLPDSDTSKNTYNNEIIRNNARNYFSHSMAERGYTANVDTPDVFLDLAIKTAKKQLIYTETFPDNYYFHNPFYFPFPNQYYYANPYYYNYDYTWVTRKEDYVEGSITLNVIDRKLNKLIWTGTVKGDMYDPMYLKENLNPAVYSIIKKYPVKPINPANCKKKKC